MTTFNDERLRWRDIPLEQVLGAHGMTISHLRQAGYKTLGGVLAATEMELVANVRAIGPVRAADIRNRALKAARQFQRDAETRATRARNAEIARAALARKRAQAREAAAQEPQAAPAVAPYSEVALEWPDRIGQRSWVPELGLAFIALAAIALFGFALGIAIVQA